jgi:hypothetical protein
MDKDTRFTGNSTVKQLAPRFTGNPTVKQPPAAKISTPATEDTGQGASVLEVGILLGLLIGEGHFGGDGRQPHITLRMHTDHETLFRWLEKTFPGGKLYGPYHHGGRSYFQWMARGAFLRQELLPLLDQHLHPDLDAKAHHRYQEMKSRYGLG